MLRKISCSYYSDFEEESFMNDVGVEYFRMFPKTFYREVIKDLSAKIRIDGDRMIVTFDYFD